MKKITIALAKGDWRTTRWRCLRSAALRAAAQRGRRLVVEPGKRRPSYSSPSDVPTYNERGVADLGIVGKDIDEARLPGL